MDFRELRHQVENMGLFRVNPWFFIGHLFQVLFLEVLAYVILCYYGVGWTPYLTAVILLVIAQVSQENNIFIRRYLPCLLSVYEFS